MDRVFQEEKKKLAEVEAKIDAIASKYEKEANEVYAEVLDFGYCVDNEDRMKLGELRQKHYEKAALAYQFRSYQPSPYFGRVDLDANNSGETTTYYIGNESVLVDKEKIVFDWRDNRFGSCYYASNQEEFLIRGARYRLALKRELNIKNCTLMMYHTVYDKESASLGGDVIDPFLLDVLHDKRRYHRLTDIIRTIQANQNEIIRKPRSESFAVQGCAGSGKTMILLHRLSFLKYNNPTMSLRCVKIITPNKFFDAYINDLSVELGLTNIERLSVEEYYVALMKRYSSKIIASTSVHSEKTLNADLLADVYSIQYLSDSISHYHRYWNEVLSQLDEIRLKPIFERFQVPYPNTAIHTSDTCNSLVHGFYTIKNSCKRTRKLAERLTNHDKEIAECQADLDRAVNQPGSTQARTVSQSDSENAAYHAQRSDYHQIEKKLNKLIQSRKKVEQQLQERVKFSLTVEEESYLAHCYQTLNWLRFSVITRYVMLSDLVLKYRQYGQTYDKTNYRHKLYLKLLYCHLYYARLMEPDNFLHIDEAQDISVAEYHLLRMVLGDGCVFNLYGDINQTVYSYKGISDWNEIANITKRNLYTLHENYRNTMQITEFCNKEFDSDILPIGISGEPVVELDPAAAVQWAVQFKQQHPEYRVAVLHHHGVKAVQDLLHSLLVDQDVSWYAVDDTKLSVISVEAAKGLEFEVVVAIVDQMSANETYVTYTRALDRLIVVRDHFPADIVSHEEAEDREDRFPEPVEWEPASSTDWRPSSACFTSGLESSSAAN